VLMNTMPTKANADTSPTVFQMVDGASVKINNDGGIRWKVKMDQATKNNIVENDNVSLKFIVTYADFFANVTDDKYYETLSEGSRAYIIPIDEAKIYQVDDLYYANACITAFTKGYADNYVALAVIDNAGSYTYATVDGLGVEDANFSINKTKTNLYGLLNLAVLDISDDYATSALSCSAYEGWFGSESYPVKVDDVDAYDSLLTNINKGISYGSVQIEVADTVDPSDATVELEEGKQLPNNTYAIRTVNFYAEDRETILETVSVKDYGEGAAASTDEVPTKESTVDTVYSFDAWVKADGSSVNLNAVTESIDVYPSFDENVREYTITWNDENGNLITTTSAPYGFEPIYDGETPTKEPNGLDVYEFVGWEPEVVEVSGDATYTAKFKTLPKHLISTAAAYTDTTFTYVDEYSSDEDKAKLPDGSENGYIVSYPQFRSGQQFTNTLRGYFEANKTYEITIFVRIVEFSPDTWWWLDQYVNGVKTPDLLGWSQGQSSTYSFGYTVEEDTTEITFAYFMARDAFQGQNFVYSINVVWEEVTAYTITWQNYDGTELDTDIVMEGALPTYTGEQPTRPAVGNTTYTFSGWTPTIVAATTDAVYTATYLEDRPYTASVSSAYSNRVAISYIDTNSSAEDQAKLPTGTTEAYLFDWSSFPSGVQITNTIEGNFEAGKTYKVTISIKHISTDASSWWYRETVDGTFMTDEKIQWWNGVTDSVHVVEKTFDQNATELKTIYQLENNGADGKKLVFAISVSYEEMLPHTVSTSSSNVTFTYINENSSEDLIANLPSGCLEGYLVACDVGTNGSISVTNTLLGNFEAGKTYAFTVKIHHISGTVPVGSACWELFSDETNILDGGTIAAWSKNASYTFNVSFDAAATTYSTVLRFYNGNGVGTLNCTISYSWAEVVAE